MPKGTFRQRAAIEYLDQRPIQSREVVVQSPEGSAARYPEILQYLCQGFLEIYEYYVLLE